MESLAVFMTQFVWFFIVWSVLAYFVVWPWSLRLTAGMRADCIFGVLDYDERPLLAVSGLSLCRFWLHLKVRFREKRPVRFPQYT